MVIVSVSSEPWSWSYFLLYHCCLEKHFVFHIWTRRIKIHFLFLLYLILFLPSSMASIRNQTQTWSIIWKHITERKSLPASFQTQFFFMCILHPNQDFLIMSVSQISDSEWCDQLLVSGHQYSKPPSKKNRKLIYFVLYFIHDVKYFNFNFHVLHSLIQISRSDFDFPWEVKVHRLFRS